MFKSIKNKLVDILETLQGTGKPLKAVFGYIEPTPQNYPCAMVRISGTSTENRLDTNSNEVTAEFTIRVLLRVDNSEAAEDQRLDLLDSILDAFRSATYVDTLGGTVEKFDVASIVQIETNEDQPAFGFDLIVNASKIETIS